MSLELEKPIVMMTIAGKEEINMENNMENFEDYLMRKYPSLFMENKEGKRYVECWSGCPEAWEDILDDLCGSIVDYIKNTRRSIDGKLVPPPDVKIVQFKSKFNMLRFYINGGDDYVHGMIHFAEYLCSKR